MLCPPNSQSQVYRTGILHTALSWSWRMTSPSDGPQLCVYFLQSQPTWLTSVTPLVFAAISPSDLWKLNNPQGQVKSLLLGLYECHHSKRKMYQTCADTVDTDRHRHTCAHTRTHTESLTRWFDKVKIGKSPASKCLFCLLTVGCRALLWDFRKQRG